MVNLDIIFNYASKILNFQFIFFLIMLILSTRLIQNNDIFQKHNIPYISNPLLEIEYVKNKAFELNTKRCPIFIVSSLNALRSLQYFNQIDKNSQILTLDYSAEVLVMEGFVKVTGIGSSIVDIKQYIISNKDYLNQFIIFYCKGNYAQNLSNVILFHIDNFFEYIVYHTTYNSNLNLETQEKWHDISHIVLFSKKIVQSFCQAMKNYSLKIDNRKKFLVISEEVKSILKDQYPFIPQKNIILCKNSYELANYLIV